MKEIRNGNKVLISLRDKTTLNGVVHDHTNDRLLILIDEIDVEKAKNIKELDEMALRVETHLGNKLMLTSLISEINKHYCIIVENNPEVEVAQKRQAVRLTIDFKFIVRQDKKMIECTSKNISAGGMAFYTNAEFGIGQEINIEFPSNVFDKRIETVGRILKVEDNEYAAKFLNLSQNDEDKIVKYIFKMMVKK